MGSGSTTPDSEYKHIRLIALVVLCNVFYASFISCGGSAIYGEHGTEYFCVNIIVI